MSRRTRYVVLLATIIGMLPAALDQTIVDTALPRMLAELGGLSLWGWVITVYLLTSTATVPVVGRLTDMFGRKPFFMGAIAIFVGASALCGFAQSMPALIIFRALQGLGGGVLFPIGSTIAGDLFSGAERSRNQGLFVGVFGLATVIGPQVGGWMVDTWGWRSIFFINLPLGILALGLLAVAFNEQWQRERTPIDLVGSGLIVTCISLLLLGFQQVGNTAWQLSDWQSIATFSVALACLGFFLIAERRAVAPVLDLSLFRNRIFVVVCVLAVLMGSAFLGTLVFVPWFMQGVLGVSATTAGSVMTPMMVSLIIGGGLGSQLARRVAYRIQFGFGFLLLIAAFLLMTQFSLSTSQLYASIATMVAGLGSGLIIPLLTITVQNVFPSEQRGVVTSATTLFRQIGQTAGTTLFLVPFNRQMINAFEPVMGPVLSKLPAQAGAGLRQAFATQPLNLIQLLLNQQVAAQLPASIREPVLQAVRVMFTSSIHQVYFLGVGVGIAGLLVALTLGRTRMDVARSQLEPHGQPAWSLE